MKLLYTLLLLAAFHSLAAQNITQIEYFIDTDKGHGQNTLVNVPPGADVEVAFTVPLTNVAPGFHLLFIRAKDSNGNWGITSQKAMYVDKGKSNPNIVRLDYAYRNSNGDISATYGYVVPEPAPAVDLTFPATVEGLVDNQAYTILIYATNENGIRSLVNALDFTYQPVVPINITLSKTDIGCNGANNGTITATASGGEGTLQYSLDGVTYQSGNTFTALEAGTFTVYVKGAVADYVETAEITIVEPQALELAVVGTPSPTCPSDLAGVITVSASGGTAPYQYRLGTGTFQAGATFSNLAAGAYPITVRDANGCETSLNVTLTAQNNVSAKPVVLIKEGTEGLSDVFVLTSSVAAGSYQWYRNGQPIAGATSRDYEVTAADFAGGGSVNFAVEIALASSPCKSLSDPFALTPLDRPHALAGIQLYPNPTTSWLQVEGLPIGKANSLVMRDLQGRELLRSSVGSGTSAVLNVSGYPAGLYLLEIESEGLRAFRKVVIGH